MINELQRHIFDAIPMLSDVSRKRIAQVVLDEIAAVTDAKPTAYLVIFTEPVYAEKANKIGIIKAIREASRPITMSLVEAKAASEFPVGREILRFATQGDAARFACELSDLGAKVEICQVEG
jgi:ribosomal protein L7/L12